MRLSASRENYTRRGEDYLRDLPAAVKKVPPKLQRGDVKPVADVIASLPQTYG